MTMVSFFLRKDGQVLNSQLAEAARRAQVSADEGNTSGVMSTDIVLSMGNKARRNSTIIMKLTYKTFRKRQGLKSALKTRTVLIQPSTSTLNKRKSEGESMSGKLRTMKGKQIFMSK